MRAMTSLRYFSGSGPLSFAVSTQEQTSAAERIEVSELSAVLLMAAYRAPKVCRRQQGA